MSWLVKGYLAWSLSVALWLCVALSLGWKVPSLGLGSGGTSGSRSGGGFFTHSSWSFGK